MKRKRKKKIIKNKRKRKKKTIRTRKWRKSSRGQDVGRTVLNLLTSAMNTSDAVSRKYYDQAIDLLDDIAISKEILKDIIANFTCRVIENKEEKR